MSKYFLSLIFCLSSVALMVQSCSPAHGNETGHEYMPDMAHSVAMEAMKIDEYSTHTWDKQSTRTLVQLWGTPRLPIKGTIPRGSVGLMSGDIGEMRKELTGQNKGITTPINGNVPYYYANTEEERTRATKEIAMNPFPITAAGLQRGKELWTIYCGICHGAKCGGNGYLVSDENPNVKYPAQPANLLLDTFANGNNGRIYHAIMFGKNVMGNYADKLSYEERWQVIHYIRSQQAEAKKLQYDEKQNAFRPLQAISDSAYKASLVSKISSTKTVEPTVKKIGTAVKEGTSMEHKSR